MASSAAERVPSIEELYRAIEALPPGLTGEILEPEAEVRFAERLAVPDLAGWCLGPDEPVPPTFVYENPIVRRPDWCCEVPSATTQTIDRDKKVPLYAEAGVAWIWLVDPIDRGIEVLKTVDGRATRIEIIEGDARRVIPPFVSEVDTSRWWLPERSG